ncbi:MAG: hypothetical protein KDK70_28425 [Myxococcales bacterium]|nr:hypothetical protein [Myxococcales bacterium]
MILPLVLAAAPEGSGEPDSSPSATSAPAEPVLVEACDGARTTPTKDARALGCTRWVIAWQQDGAPWGLVVSDGYDEVIAARERQLGFARRYARFFEVPLDPRYAQPSAPICQTCKDSTPAGRWGEGQRFGDGAARKAITAAREELRALDAAVGEHLPHLEDAARLAREPSLGKLARAYAAQLQQAVVLLARSELSLDNASVFRSETLAKETGKGARAQVEELAAAHAKLVEAVGKEVGKAHGGKYMENGGQGPDTPYLQVQIDGAKVTATYFAGGGQSTWFEGQVALDGGITGRSLVAPEKGTLSCQQHTEACGYVYISSVLRFTERKDPDETTRSVAELWFRRSNWVMAKPFMR